MERKNFVFDEADYGKQLTVLLRDLRNRGMGRNAVMNSCKTMAEEYKAILQRLRVVQAQGNSVGESEWAVHAMREHIRAIVYHTSEMEKLERAAMSEVNFLRTTLQRDLLTGQSDA